MYVYWRYENTTYRRTSTEDMKFQFIQFVGVNAELGFSLGDKFPSLITPLKGRTLAPYNWSDIWSTLTYILYHP